jgi:hypothetical protein
MAQKILIRRGGIDNLSATIGVSKGELIYASGSLNGVEHVVFIANADGNNTFTPVNKIYTGTAAANSFNASLNGVPYYKTDSQALFILNSAGSTALDLSGNLEGTQISSITASGSFSGSFQGNGSGLTNLTLSSIVAPGNDTEVLFNNGGAIAASSNLKITGSSLDAAALNIVTTGNVTASNLQLSGNADITGNIVLGGSITIGDQTTDNIQVGGEFTSDLIPDADSTYNLGSNPQRWLNIYVDNVSGSTADFSGGVSTLGYITAGGVLDVAGAGTIGNGLTVTGSGTFTSTVTAATGISSSGWLYAGGNLDVDGTSTLTGNTSVGGTLEVTTGISSSGWLYAAGNLDIDGTSTLTGNTSVGGTLTVTGQTDLNGNVVLGDAATDTVAFKADVSSSIIPSANATFDIGASSDKWLNGYFVSASIDSLTIGGIDPTAQDLDDVMANGNSTDSDFILNNNGNQTITHTGATGNLTISSDNGDVYVEGTRFTGNDVVVAGNLTVAGTQTIVNSTTVEIGDNIIVLNAAGIAADGGIIVQDAVGAQTASGSLLWNATDDYWYAGTSGSTQYRLVQFAAGTGVTDNYLPKSANDGSKHLTNSIISDDGTTATIHGNISGSLLQVNTGIEASGLTGIIDTSSRAIFRDGSNRLGALATTDSAIEVSTLIGYKADGTFVATSVIDGGTF